jgi:hypothetical protein
MDPTTQQQLAMQQQQPYMMGGMGGMGGCTSLFLFLLLLPIRKREDMHR